MTAQRASLYLIAGGCMWGIYWLPLRMLEQLGMTGTSAGIILYITCLIGLFPVIWRYRAIIISQWRILLFSGMMTGCAFSLYTTSLSYTDVIRSILLFYLTPVWGTLLGVFILRESVTFARIAVILCAFLGLYAILGSGNNLPIPRNLGDVLALLSGIFWAIGSLGLLRAQTIPVMPQLISFLAGSLVVSLLSLALIGDFPALPQTAIDWFYIIGFTACFALFAIPMFWLTIAPARILTPARVGILLMSEVVVGAVSAMLFSGEPFGQAELLGTILIMLAALIEVITASRSDKRDKPAPI